MTTRTAKDAHIGALDGLRAAAILLVLLYHLTPGRDPNLGLRSLHYKLAEIGWSGVDLFFVLSGFLITTKLIEARGERHRFRNFYVRRALRIFPLYYLALAIVFLANRYPAEMRLPFWLYYSNFAPQPIPSLAHFWSLAIEEQFYLVWPAVIFLASGRAARWVCAVTIAGAPLLRYALASAGAAYEATYAWTPSRADALAWGALIALVYAHARTDVRLRQRLFRWSVVLFAIAAPLPLWAMWRSVAVFVVKSDSDPTSLLIRTLLPSAVALLYASLLVLSLEVRPLARVLTGRMQTLLARYSYGIYVWHFLLLPLVLRVLPPEPRPMLVFTAASMTSLAAAVVSYHGYEAFFLGWKSRLSEVDRAEARP